MKKLLLYFLLPCLLYACGSSTPKNSIKNSLENPAKPFVIELIRNEGDSLNRNVLTETCRELGIDATSFYEWKNHLVIFAKMKNPDEVQSKLRTVFSNQEVKLYNDNFYEFNRSHCADTTTAAEWDHTLLTANMVDDTVMQNEYLQYHATQFTEWPEISNGFCNASFQQLLLFKNGRQLMLIISIPKGESLAELDPKTLENNPRVEEWNTIMKKYQEGIAGTEPGTTWVLLSPISK